MTPVFNCSHSERLSIPCLSLFLDYHDLSLAFYDICLCQDIRDICLYHLCVMTSVIVMFMTSVMPIMTSAFSPSLS